MNVLFLYRYAGLSALRLAVAALLPLTVIVFALAALNLERAVFEFMSGNTQPGTSADDAYAVLFFISVVSSVVAPLLLIAYVVLVFLAWRRRRSVGAT